MKEFLVFSSLIYGFLFLGWGVRKGRPASERHSKSISRFTVLLIEGPMLGLIYWGIEVEDFVRHFRLAVIGVIVLALSGVVGYYVARLYRQNRQFVGAFTVGSMLSNNGATLGGFVCLLYLGDRGLELSQLWALLLVPYFFTAVFIVARRFSPGRKLGLVDAVKENFQDPVSILPIVATVAGVLLSVCGVAFPGSLEMPRTVLVFASVILYSFSFGLGMHARRMLGAWKSLLGMLPVKFVAGPLIGLAFALLLGYRWGTDPLAFKVLLIQSAMPVAIWSVVACKLFDLDDDLAVGLWIFTTLSVAPLVPLFGWLSRL